MNNAGIIAQYGFLFQRKVFIYYVLSNIATNKSFSFEGKDDIDVSIEESIYSMSTSGDSFVQVKSASVDETCFYKIICNWLLAEEKNIKFILFLENELSFPIDNAMQDRILEYISVGRTKKKSSIARKAFEKYKDSIINGDSILAEKVSTLLKTFEREIFDMETLDQKLEELFFSTYCQDIKEYSLAKVKRLERFITYINQDIDASIKQKTPYTLIYSDFIKLILRVCEEISDEKYIANVLELKRNARDKAARIVAERSTREVKQLYTVDQSDQFVIDGIVHELIYKDFREIYAAQKELELANIEQDAHENYTTALFSLDEESSRIPKRVYQETVRIPIEGSLLPSGSIYRKGCYIYLTGDNVADENMISWSEENGQE